MGASRLRVGLYLVIALTTYSLFPKRSRWKVRSHSANLSLSTTSGEQFLPQRLAAALADANGLAVLEVDEDLDLLFRFHILSSSPDYFMGIFTPS